ncbi:hypothetical protein M9H77_02151 [Catharanthus roseus]|uniref:Uncharacterized protein n=1 Tax=Catharanthus roseus TaxID=4058 RepID=A0ACC0C7Z6_CATRO|nr:hypothetical protein M9H77_02151 [Catharanthus roseus]
MNAIDARMQNLDASIRNLETQIGQIAKLLNDERSFSFPCMIGNFPIDKALEDLGASINVMSYNMCKKLGLGNPTPTRMSISLANKRTIASASSKRAQITNPSSPKIDPSGVYCPSLVKEFYTNITQKNNKDLITSKTTIKRVNITLDRTLFPHIASIPNEGLAITFSLKQNEASHRVGIHPQPNTGLKQREDFGHTCTKPARWPGRVVADEEEDEGNKKETKGSNEEYDDSDSSICATLELMQTRQTQHSNALVGIQLILSRIYGHLFMDEGKSGNGGAKGRSAL